MQIPAAALDAIRSATSAAAELAERRDLLIRGVILGLGLDPEDTLSLDLEAGTIEPLAAQEDS